MDRVPNHTRQRFLVEQSCLVAGIRCIFFANDFLYEVICCRLCLDRNNVDQIQPRSNDFLGVPSVTAMFLGSDEIKKTY